MAQKPLYYKPDGSPKTPPACFNFDRDLALAECARLEMERDEARRVARVLDHAVLTGERNVCLDDIQSALMSVKSWGEK